MDTDVLDILTKMRRFKRSPEWIILKEASETYDPEEAELHKIQIAEASITCKSIPKVINFSNIKFFELRGNGTHKGECNS